MHRFSRILPLALAIAWPLHVADSARGEEKAASEKIDPAADINAPRADARSIEFETSEGTWMSVDVSPDGRTLVFDLLGDIYARVAAPVP